MNMFRNESIDVQIKISLVECLLQASTSINNRKLFLKQANYAVIMDNCLVIDKWFKDPQDM